MNGDSGTESGRDRELGVSKEFLTRLESSGASKEFVDRLRSGGKPPRSRFVDVVLKSAPKVGLLTAFASDFLSTGGAIPLAVAGVVAGVVVVVDFVTSRNEDDQVVIPPANLGERQDEEA